MRTLLMLSIIAATSVGSATVALAMQSTTSQPSDRDRLVCKTEQKTGSRFGRRSCLPRSERERRADNHQKAMDDIRGPIIFDCRQSRTVAGQAPISC